MVRFGAGLIFDGGRTISINVPPNDFIYAFIVIIVLKRLLRPLSLKCVTKIKMGVNNIEFHEVFKKNQDLANFCEILTFKVTFKLFFL